MIKDVSIEIIQRCLNQCLHCSSCSTSKSIAILSKNVIQETVDGLFAIGVERICLSGGEPFLHPDLLDIVSYISQKDIIVDIYSCGIIGSEEAPVAIPIELLEKAKLNGLRSIIFNMSAIAEDTYNLITQTKGHFPLLKESIKNTVTAGVLAEIHFVPMSVNYKEVTQVIDHAEQIGVKQINFLKLVPHGRAKQFFKEIAIDDESLLSLQKELVAHKNKGKAIRIGVPLLVDGATTPCHAISEKLYIKFDGSVFGCEAFKYIMFNSENGDMILPDNIHDTSIVEIYNNSHYLTESKKLVNYYSSCAVGCENCPVQKHIKLQEGSI